MEAIHKVQGYLGEDVIYARHTFFGGKTGWMLNMNTATGGRIQELSPSGDYVNIDGTWYMSSRIYVLERIPKPEATPIPRCPTIG